MKVRRLRRGDKVMAFEGEEDDVKEEVDSAVETDMYVWGRATVWP